MQQNNLEHKTDTDYSYETFDTVYSFWKEGQTSALWVVEPSASYYLCPCMCLMSSKLQLWIQHQRPLKKTTKIQKRLMTGTLKEETKRGGQRKAKRHTSHTNQEKRRKLVLLMLGDNFTHSPLMLHGCKSWNLIVIMRGLKQASPTNTIFLSITEAKACWKAILTCYMKN